MRFAGGLLAASWGQAVAAIVLLFSLRIYSAELGAVPFGAAMLALGGMALFDGFTTSAFGQVLAQLLKDLDDGRKRIGLGLGLGCDMALFQAVTGAAAIILTGIFLDWTSAGVLAVLLPAFCILEPVRLTGQMVLLLERRYAALSTWIALEAVMTLFFSVIAIKLTQGNPASLVAGAVAGRIVSASIGGIAIIGSKFNVDRDAARIARPRAIRFGSSVAIMGPLGWLGLFADRYIVGATTGLAQAGVLAALSGAVAKPYGVITSGLTNRFRPDMLDEAAGKERDGFSPLTIWLLTALTIGGAGLLGFIFLSDQFADFLIAFPTPGLDMGTLLTVLAASQMLVLLTHAFDNQLLAAGQSRPLLLTQIAVLIIGLPLIAIGAVWSGAIGAAIGRFGNEGLKLVAVAVLVTIVTRKSGRNSGEAA
ncbi:hypothetical protein [Altererythrobacter aquiaggeris]|uniref:lipopolysaccharide biosynthesis protein n=1 Tax=Aestuarierythrobacter aquiaggeris TaxID=1898396 RepID=UPI00301760A1